MLPSLVVSSIECIHALLSVGFRRSGSAEGAAVLTRGYRLVVVPEVPMLAPEVLASILEAAGMAVGEFVELVGQAPTMRMPKLPDELPESSS